MIQNIVSWLRGDRCVVIWRSRAVIQCCDTATTCCDTAYDTAPGAPRHDQLSSQPGPWVGALCTQLSFDSVHYSELLFGTLFMNIVHEVFQKIKK